MIHLKFMGVRGTMPVHGEAHARFGGATSCVFLRMGGEALVLDAGTGLRSEAFRAFFPEKRFSMLITHAHADHILGFPPFAPLFDPECTCDVYLKTREGRSARAQIEALMTPPLWPVRTDSLKAKLRFCDVAEAFNIGNVQIRTMEARHPGGCTMYRISCGGKSIVYATDFEPEDGDPAFCAFAADCTLLLLDAQYTDAEYVRTKGFGHSTIARSAALAQRCNARQTILIHHDPTRTDAQLLQMEQALQAEDPRIRFAREGEELFL